MCGNHVGDPFSDRGRLALSGGVDAINRFCYPVKRWVYRIGRSQDSDHQAAVGVKIREVVLAASGRIEVPVVALADQPR